VKKFDVVKCILADIETPKRDKGVAFAPTNIALCKYWGKRDQELNLPMTSSLSVALPDRGALTTLSIVDQAEDEIRLNEETLSPGSQFVKRVVSFLDLFRRDKNWRLQIDIKMNLPLAAGLASSASGFASLTAALNDLFLWQLSKTNLSILARLGSGSAARSFWNGFVEWHAGIQPDGMDSFAASLDIEWNELYIGILPISLEEKPISSREAMQKTVDTSILYGCWPKKVSRDMVILRRALHSKNFAFLGGTSESNALAMHGTMLSAWPPICYFLPETLREMQKVWRLRQEGLPLYFTQDAGPNLKLIFQEKDKEDVKSQFPSVDIIKLFE
jgi:diphosphomevalonate decarboxylase